MLPHLPAYTHSTSILSSDYAPGSRNQEEEISVLALKELTILGRDKCTPDSSNTGISGVTEGHTRCYWVNQKPPAHCK